jgi:hypothetical protein
MSGRSVQLGVSLHRPKSIKSSVRLPKMTNCPGCIPPNIIAPIVPMTIRNQSKPSAKEN